MLNNSAKNVSNKNSKSSNLFRLTKSLGGLNETFNTGSGMQRMQSAADIIMTIAAMI